MGLATLRPGQRVRLDGVYFDLAGLLPSRNWQLIEVDTGERDEKSADELWSAFLQQRLKFILKDQPSATNPKLLERLSGTALETQHTYDDEAVNSALRKWKFVQEFTKLKGILPIRDAREEAAKKIDWGEEAPPKLRAAQHWCAKVRDASDPVLALVSKQDHKGNPSERYPQTVVDIVDEIIKTQYLKRTPRITVCAAARAAARAVRGENRSRPRSKQLPVPGRRCVESRIKLIPERERIAARYGSDVAMMKMRTSLGGVEATRVLERGEIDHTTLAIVLLDDEDHMPWGRASSSLCLDACTHVPTGMYKGPEVPSIVSVAHCIDSSILPKTELLKQYPDVKGRWDCYGVHETYVIDNGLEEHARALRQAASELGGSTIEFCPRKAPWFKPLVERHFRRQDQDLLQLLPGCTGENISVRPQFDPMKDLLLTRSTFDKVYMIWLVDIYLHEPQNSLDHISPIEQWKRTITLEDQRVPTRRVLLQRLFLRKEEGRSLDHEGIQYDCLIYNSLDMGALRAEMGARLIVDIWVSDEDLGYIYVEVPGKDISIRVPCLNQHYASGLSRFQHKKCKEAQRVGIDEGLQLSLDDARERISILIDADFDELRHARRKRRARFVEGGTTYPPDASPPNATAVPQAPKPTTGAADSSLMRSADEAAPVLPHVSLSGGVNHETT